jgi:hypothetical protein
MRIAPTRIEEPGTKRPLLLPWLISLAVGTILIGSWFILQPAFGPDGYVGPFVHRFTATWGFNRPILALFVPFGLALWAWRRGARTSLRLLIGGAMVLHVLLLFAPPPQSQDLYQYLFYGRMQMLHPPSGTGQMLILHGANPYVVQPSTVYSWVCPGNLCRTNPTWYTWLHWPNQTSVYGPVWSLLMLGVARVAGSSLLTAFLVYKFVILAIDAAIVWMIVEAARESHPARDEFTGAAGWGVLAYAWNPLVLITVPLGGLVDTAIAACFLGAYLARRRNHMVLVTVLLTAASMIKVYAVIGLLLHLLLLLRERGVRTTARHTAVFGSMAILLTIPYWAGLNTFRGVVHVADLSNKSLTGTIQRILTIPLRWTGIGEPPRVAGQIVRGVAFAVLAAGVLWAVRRVWREGDLWACVLAVLCLYLLVTPWFLYWYLLTPIVLVAVMPRNRLTDPVLVFSGTGMFTAAFPPWLFGNVTQALLRYAVPVAVYVREPARRRHGHADILELPAPDDEGVPAGGNGDRVPDDRGSSEEPLPAGA